MKLFRMLMLSISCAIVLCSSVDAAQKHQKHQKNKQVAVVKNKKDNHSRKYLQGPRGHRGFQGPRGFQGSCGMPGTSCPLSYGNFLVLTPEEGAIIVPEGNAIPFDTSILNSPFVTLVTDTTFNPGAKAVAISIPGIYEVTFGVATSIDSWYSLTLNGVPYEGGIIAINGGGTDGSLISITTLIAISESDLFNGQRGSALLEVINPSPIPCDVAEPFTTEIGSAPCTVASYINVVSIF